MRRTEVGITAIRRAFRLPRLLLCVALLGAALPPPAASAQAPASVRDMLSQPPLAWVEAAARNQNNIINEDGSEPLRYRLRKVDAKGDTTRELIESREGTVARLIQRNGGPLTTAENEAERDRLNDILRSPDEFLKHRRRDHAARGYATELVTEMPKAMIWTYAPNQPQPPHAAGPQIVLDFTPKPGYKPPTLVSEALTGIAGRLWVDARTRCVTRIQGRILHAVDFGWGGLLARINEGGTIEFEQAPAASNRWIYSHLDEHITVREVLVHTVTENTQMNAWDFQTLPAPLSYRDAIQELLAMPVPTR